MAEVNQTGKMGREGKEKSGRVGQERKGCGGQGPGRNIKERKNKIF